MLRMVNLLIALSLGTQRAQLEQRTGLTWPRPFLLRPLLKREKELKSVFQAQKIFFFFWMIPFCHYHGGWEIVDIDIEAPTSFPRRQ